MEVRIKMDIKPGEIRCPRCFGRDIVGSKPRGWRDALMRKFHREPRHCRSCANRFYVVIRAKEDVEPGSPPAV